MGCAAVVGIVVIWTAALMSIAGSLETMSKRFQDHAYDIRNACSVFVSFVHDRSGSIRKQVERIMKEGK